MDKKILLGIKIIAVLLVATFSIITNAYSKYMSIVFWVLIFYLIANILGILDKRDEQKKVSKKQTIAINIFGILIAGVFIYAYFLVIIYQRLNLLFLLAIISVVTIIAVIKLIRLQQAEPGGLITVFCGWLLRRR